MERSRSYSGGWTTRPKHPKIATVKPVSKSLSEDNLIKTVEDKQAPRVFSRLKVQDLSLLKKDSLIGELEKCLEELEKKHGSTQDLSCEYQKVETERDGLLGELDMAFQDLQQYMQHQKLIEDQKLEVETERDELLKENEYLKEVLSARTEIQTLKLREDNKIIVERVKDLELKNTELLDEINGLYEERQTLITSLLNLNSQDVDEVIKTRSRSSSVTSRESLDLRGRLDDETLVARLKELEESGDVEALKAELAHLVKEHSRLSAAFDRVKEERNECEKENENLEVELDDKEKTLEEKNKEFIKLQKDRNEKNLSLSKMNLEKRTLQRQLDHMRESNRTNTSKITSLNEEIERLNLKTEELEELLENSGGVGDDKLKEVTDDYDQRLSNQLNEFQKLLDEKNNTETEFEKFKNENDSQLADSLTMIKDLELERENVQKELDSMSKTLEEVKRVSLTQSSELEKSKALQMRYNNLQDKLTQIEHVVEIAEQEKEELHKTTVNLKSQHDILQNHLKEKEHALINIEKENTSLREQLNSEKSILSINQDDFRNQINVLETEKTKLQSSKEMIEAMLRNSEESDKTLRETCEELRTKLKSFEEEKINSTLSAREQHDKVTIMQRKHDVIKKENERLLAKCRQLEKSAGDTEHYTSEIKRLQEANEILLQRCRSLQSVKTSEHNFADQIASEREKYSALLVKYDNLCTKNDNLCSQHKQVNSNFDVNLKELKSLRERIKTLEHHVKEMDDNFDEKSKENCALKDQISLLEVENKNVTNERTEQNFGSPQTASQNEIDTLRKQNNILRNENNNLQTRLQSLFNEIKDLKNNKEIVAKDYQYILKSHKEEAKAELVNQQNRIVLERDAIKTKYDLLRVDFEKHNKEKEHFKKTIESLREENTKLHEQVRKHRLMSNSTQELMVRRLREENEALERNVESLQDAMNKVNVENRSLIERINRNDENISTTIRSLKARKNELQLQVETLKHDNQQLQLNLSTRSTPNTLKASSIPNISTNTPNIDPMLAENLRNAHSKIAELELNNREYSRKLQESETLLYDLQQALAKANDLAMQKALEGTKTKKTLEKKVEKLQHENLDLKKKAYFTNKTGDLSPNSIFSRSPVTARKINGDAKMSRKVSLPVKIRNPEAVDSPSFLQTGNIFTYQDSRLSFDTDYSRLSSSVPESPRLQASRQMENDLSQQLRELLDLTNDLTAVKEEDPVNPLDESVAPPVPPPPVSYETKAKELPTETTSEDIDGILESLTQVADDLDREKTGPKGFEHWV